MKRRPLSLFCAGLFLLAIVFSYPLIRHINHGLPYSFIPIPGIELARMEVVSALGEVLASRALELRERPLPNAYEPITLQIELTKPELISFRPWPSPKARLSLDRIEVERVPDSRAGIPLL